jgi:IclR family transcriptional regulator, KDG regulon repressor
VIPTSKAETSPHGSGQKLLAVLQQFAREDADLGVTELSQLTGMDKTSIFRALKTLELYRFIEQDSTTRKYRLGFAVVELANAKLKQMPLALVAQPYLARLSRETGETVQMSVMDHLRVHYIGVVESSQPIRVGMAVGSYGPIYCTAAGKVFLANAPPADQEEVLSRPLTKFTGRTVVDPKRLRKELLDVRTRGWSTDNEGFTKHLRVAAAPIRDVTGRVVAALAVGGPTIRVSRRRLDSFIPLLLETAAEISKELLPAVERRLPWDAAASERIPSSRSRR